ncbi:Sodium/calcium exchanger protein-domain-containing protein [Gamsiella multidivaricata]|uniref:Sodium/calcium exchanger protein-domain-containing protein n=1 Tax=Gamsiella multidivaricata TaxID=101098 RepID=UPI00221FD9AF|nr:Sodium/calcium exchanger protein-domain-containing protein [Gamsiella multidivaricata]KAI7832448.1 Sodium/calcium exchanger protein-domain-containing protein [Gamsiella multidivaricata]
MASEARPFYVLITLFAFVHIVTHLWPKHHSRPPGGIAAHLFKRADPADGSQCEDVWSHSDHCAYVQGFCADYHAGLINYLHFYFCDLSALHTLACILLAIWMVFLFALVGIAASDFFCPNLNTIAKKLHLSESMTGVTFLAFGNASPDIFSTFSAFGAGSETLAVGEVVGAASFISSVVIGSMTIARPFKVSPAPFFRDTIFFTGCILFTLYMVLSKRITFVQSVILIAAYISYVIIVVFGNLKNARLTQQSLAGPEVDATVEQNDAESAHSSKRDDEIGSIENVRGQMAQDLDAGLESDTHMMAMSPPSNIVAPFNPSYNSKSSARRCPAILIEQAQPPVSLVMTQNKRKGYIAVRRESADVIHVLKPSQGDDPNHDPSYTQFQQALLHHSLILPDRSDPSNRPRSPIFQVPPGGSFQDNIPVVSRRRRCTLFFNEWFMPVYFPTLLAWNEKSWILKILAVGSIPIVFMLTLTLPVVNISEDNTRDADIPRVQHAQDESRSSEDTLGSNQSIEERAYNGWCRVATMVQMIAAPVFITAAITSAAGKSPVIVLAAFGVGVIMSVLLFFFSTEEKPPRFYEALAFLGFLVAMAWIFVVANEVVGILQAFGMILGISDAILGLTVFAMGNSLGDLVANITIAKMGFPRMAFSACFGGPLLNMLLGVGISGTYVTLTTGSPITLDVSPTLLVSLGGVLVSMLGTMVVVPRCGYMLCRWWGFILVGVYVVCMVTNVVLEVRMTAGSLH